MFSVIYKFLLHGKPNQKNLRMLIRELLQGEPKANMHTRTEIPLHYKFIKQNKKKSNQRKNPKIMLVYSFLYRYCLTIDGIPKLTNWS